MVSRITTPEPIAVIYYRSFENFGISFISEELLTLDAGKGVSSKIYLSSP